MGYALAKKLRSGLERSIKSVDSRSVFQNSEFPWAEVVESFHSEIRKEAEGLLNEVDRITNFNDILPNQRALTQDDQWKSFFLIGLRKNLAENQIKCPNTTLALKEIPNVLNAFFSILRPGTQIPSHRGPYAGIMRYHLGVIIPDGDVGIKIDGRDYRWKEGESLLFDDSFEHEAWNFTDHPRVVLFVDFMRPLPKTLSLANQLMIKIFESSKTAREGKKFLQV